MGLCKTIFHLGKSLRPKHLWVITISQFHDPSISPCCQFLMDSCVDGNDMRENGTRRHARMDNIDSAKPLHCDTIAISRSAVEHNDH